jgi:hypothetical protein
VDGPGEQLLAGAALALDEDGRRAVGHLVDQGHEPTESGARPDDIASAQQVVQSLLESAVLGDEGPVLERLPDHPDELAAREGLGQEVAGAVLHGPHRFLDGAEGREHDHVHLRGHCPDLAQELEPGQPRHLEVGEDEVDPALAQTLEGGLPVGRQHDLVALARQRALETLAHGRVVVGDQEPGGVRHARSS